MKTRRMIPVMLAAVICMTGCGRQNDLNIQEDAVPVIPMETAVSGTAGSTESAAETATDTQAVTLKTTVVKTETASVTGTTVSAAGAAETAAAQSRSGSNADSSGGVSAVNTLYGKWETVSFSKDSGEHISYDLSNPVHRSYYIGLDLNESGQSSLTVGTEAHPATVSMQDKILMVDSCSRNNPVSMVFTVSADRTRMTAELLNGRIIVTLKRINRDFSIKDFLNADPVPDASALTGEWYYQEQDILMGDVYEDAGYVTVEADGTYIYQPNDGSLRRRGTVSVAYDEHPDSSKTAFYAFTENESGAFWIGTDSCNPSGKGAFYIGNGRTARLYPREPRSDDFGDYVGMWQFDSYSVQIGKQGADYLVTVRRADSASEDNVWSYLCSGMSDNTGLECTGGGTLTHIVTAADGTETRTVIYSDGDASFRCKGGRLFWSDGKENKGMEMGFEKIG